MFTLDEGVGSLIFTLPNLFRSDSLLSFEINTKLSSSFSSSIWFFQELKRSLKVLFLFQIDLHFVFTLMMNLVPTPILLSTFVQPPICSMIFLQIDNPRPVPCLFLMELSSSLPKSMNRFFLPSSEMPIPVSMTPIWSQTHIILSLSLTTYRSMTSILIDTDPFLFVNFKALDKKFIKICKYLPSSP